MNWLIVLAVVVVVVYMFSGGKREKIKSGSSKIKKFASGNKLFLAILAGFAVCWLMNSRLVEGASPDEDRGWAKEVPWAERITNQRWKEECCQVDQPGQKIDLPDFCYLDSDIDEWTAVCEAHRAQQGGE